ncbi:MAG: GH12 family glycosyl hydrolase domain-containing protein [Kineosporiaceae bacterium]
MRRLLAAGAVAVAAVALAAGGVGGARPAAAASRLCEPYAAAPLGGYLLQNNRWGADSAQCVIEAAHDGGPGFELTTSGAAMPTDGAPAGYPSLVWGCHYGRCTDGFSPIPVTSPAFGRLRTSVALSRIQEGDWDAAYDLWFDPAPRRDGHNQGAELMVWFDRAGTPRPSGHPVGEAVVEGRAYAVYLAGGRSRTVTYWSRTPTDRPSFAIGSFAADAAARGLLDPSWYLTSVQVGIEPWRGGAGLALRGFRVGM